MSQVVMLEASGGSRPTKVIAGLILLSIAGVLVWLALEYGFMAGLGAFIFGVSGIAVFVNAFSWHGKGPCASCGAIIDDLPPDMSGIPCHRCGAWHHIVAKQMSLTPDEHVTSFPIYPLRLDVGDQPPATTRCVCCGRGATRGATFEVRKTVAGAQGVARLIKVWPIQLSVCESHASLAPGVDVTAFEGEIRIKSYAAFREFKRR